MLTGKTVVLGVTGSIAAYKIPNLARMIKKLNGNVVVIMTKNAENFINPITFESLTGNKCLVDTFDRNFKYSVEHVALAKQADAVMIAPASANVIGKIASGIADDMLTTTVMACPDSSCKKIISPAMNHNMYHNPIVQDNLKKLENFGYEIIPPEKGMLANGDLGDGRMPDEKILLEYILKEIACEKDLTGKKILVTAGATRENIDPVRFITNHSTGKMGIEIARAAMRRGAEVTLVSGHTSCGEENMPMFVKNIKVTTAGEMFEAVKENFDDKDIIIKAAAVADYTPEIVMDSKIKKSDGIMNIRLKRTADILKFLGENKREKQILVGFSMETDSLVENSIKKLDEKNCDLICANSIKQKGAGFGTDTNILTLITKDSCEQLPIMTKERAAHKILDKAKKMLKEDL